MTTLACFRDLACQHVVDSRKFCQNCRRRVVDVNQTAVLGVW